MCVKVKRVSFGQLLKKSCPFPSLYVKRVLTNGEFVATKNEFVRPGCWKSCIAAAVYRAITSSAVRLAPIMPEDCSESAAAAAAATTTATM